MYKRQGLTWPTLTFNDRMVIPLGGDRGDLVLQYLGRGHTEGDIVAWLPKHRIMYAGDLVEAKAALYTGDAFHQEWSAGTLDGVKALRAEVLVGGRGAVAQGVEAVDAAIEQSRGFLTRMLDGVRRTQASGGTLKDAFETVHTDLYPTYGHWPIFEHTLPFDVARVWEELQGVERPTIWTAERDREIWAQLQG